jgi:hypothetical protein
MYKQLPLFAAVLLLGAASAAGCSQNASPARVQYQESGMIDQSGTVSYAADQGTYPRCFYDESKCKWMLDRGPCHPWYLKRYDDNCNADNDRMSFSASSCGLCNWFKPSQTCPTVKETCPAPKATCPQYKESTCPAFRGSTCPPAVYNAPVTVQPESNGWNSGY